MINRLIYVGVCLATLGLLCFAFYFYWFGTHFVRSKEDSMPTDCSIHESGRISFQLKAKDLDRMLDSFQVIHPEYILTDSMDMVYRNVEIGDCLCCCINQTRDILFSSEPKEIYKLTVKRDWTGYGYFLNTVAIDIVSKLKKGSWHCSLTSKLDSAEKQRVRNRFKLEIMSKLPMIQDTTKLFQ